MNQTHGKDDHINDKELLARDPLAWWRRQIPDEVLLQGAKSVWEWIENAHIPTEVVEKYQEIGRIDEEALQQFLAKWKDKPL